MFYSALFAVDDCSMQYIDGNPWLSPILEDDIIFKGKGSSNVYNVLTLVTACFSAILTVMHS